MARIAKVGFAALAALALTLLAPGSAVASGATSVHTGESVTAPVPSPTVYGCEVGEDGYGTKLPCELQLHVLTPICDNDVPKLQYEVVAVGSPPGSKLTITWLNPDGPDVVQTDLPLAGTVLWPGAVQNASGRGIDWPGWRLENGVWVEGDEFDWLRPTVAVRFQVNPELTVNVAYPPSTPQCLTDPPQVVLHTPSANPTTPSVLATSTTTPSPTTPSTSTPAPSTSPSTPDTAVLVDDPQPTDDTAVLVDDPVPPAVAATGANVAPLLIGAAVLVLAGGVIVLLVNRQRRSRA